ncbi:MAG: helix-turn-helix domain-containing protein [Chloroflexota bacterium]
MEQAAVSGQFWQFGREAAERVDHVRRHRGGGVQGESFGAVLKRLRLRQKVTRKALADALGLTPADIAATETGPRSPRSFDEVLCFGAALGLNVGEVNGLLHADERRELDEEERVLFMKLRLQLAYPFIERLDLGAECCIRCGQPIGDELRCRRCGTSVHL